MSTFEFLSYLESLDIRLSLKGDRLSCNAPKGALTDQIQSEIADRKSEILKILHGRAYSEIRSISREAGSELPLSYAQQLMWISQQIEPENFAHNMPKTLILKGVINFNALQKALQCIVSRHEPLRTNFIESEGKPIQVINPSPSFNLPLIDLSDLQSEQQTVALQTALRRNVSSLFDLTSDLMLRALLIRLSNREHVFQVVMHHIASDGWSLSIFTRELVALYEAFSEDKPNPLTDLIVQYADFAHWQRHYLSGERLDSYLNYWKKQLSGAPPLLALPTDFPRPSKQFYRGSYQAFTLSPDLTAALKQLGQQSGNSLFFVLLAAFKTLIHRYSQQLDIVVGTPIANRNLEEIENLIGFFVNTLVLRTDMSGNPSFTELLGRVRQVALGAFAHQEMPFEKIVEEIKPDRSLSYPPLYQVMFAFHNTPKSKLKLGELDIEEIFVESGASLFDQTLNITETDNVLEGQWAFNTDLYKPETIQRSIGHFQSLLEGIVANPSQPISQLSLLEKSEREQLLHGWKKSKQIYDLKCVHKLFEERVVIAPEAIAVEKEGLVLTYGELNSRANQLAHYLRSIGIKADQFVGIAVERSLEMIIGLLGILKAGAAYVPLDPAYPPERLAYMIDDAKISILLTQSKWIDKLPNHQAQVICLDTDWQKIALCNFENPTVINAEEHLAYIIYTSGSTGKPKGVMISHRALSHFTQTAIAEYAISGDDRVLQFASVNFDAAVEEIFPALCTGATLVLRTDEMLADLPTFFQTCEELQLSVLDLPTAYWHQLAGELTNGDIPLPKLLRLVIIGGEKVLLEPVRIWQEYVLRSGKGDRLQLINTYGPTEATVVATMYRIPAQTSFDRDIPIGRPLAHLQTYILDANLQPVPIGVPGELLIGGNSLATGYLNRPELTAEKFIANPFSQGSAELLYKTGDLVRYLSDGNIEFLGRIDDQVKIRGFRIELGEVESVLAQHPDVSEVVIIAREDIPGDKRLVAYVVPQQEQLHINDLTLFLKKRLPNYMVPSAFVFLEMIPLNPSGKLDRRALPIPDASSIQIGTDFVEPSNPTEETIAAIWSQVLGLERVGIHDNFFDLGGHSLLLTQVMSRCRQAFSVEISLQFLFEHPTIVDLGDRINTLLWLTNNQETNFTTTDNEMEEIEL